MIEWEILNSGVHLRSSPNPDLLNSAAKDFVGLGWCVHPDHTAGRKKATLFFGGVYLGHMSWSAPSFIGGLCDEHQTGFGGSVTPI